MRLVIKSFWRQAQVAIAFATLACATAIAFIGQASAGPKLRQPAPAVASVTGSLWYADPGPGPYGYAIQGSTTYSSDNGIFGHTTGSNSNITAILGEASSPSSTGVVGYESSTGGYGFYGWAVQGNGAFGMTQMAATPAPSSTPLHYAGMVGDDASTAGLNYGVMGETANNYGVYGVASGASGYGGYFSSSHTNGGNAILGAASGEGGLFTGFSGNSTYPALMAEGGSTGTDLFGTYNTTPAETFIVQAGTANQSQEALTGGSDVQVSGDLYVYGEVFQDCVNYPEENPVTDCLSDADLGPGVRLRTTGSLVRTYRSRESMPTSEDFGEAQLANGQAHVALDPAFAATIDLTKPYLVFLTSEGENHGLYVTAKTQNGFTVREMMNGRSASLFEYRIVAHPYDDNGTRLAAIQSTKVRHTARRAPFALRSKTESSPSITLAPAPRIPR
jgi:hypothetical protein